MSFRLSLVVTLIFFCILNPAFASRSIHESDYYAVLTDPYDGIAILEAAQDVLLSIYSEDFKQMYDIAQKAASGTYSREQLDRFDIKFQKLFTKMLFHTRAINGLPLFNRGNFSFVKNNIKYVIDLSPKNTAALGLSDDNLLSVDSAKTAVNHVNAAIDNLKHWIPQEAENNSVIAHTDTEIAKNSNAQTGNYFDSYKLYFKTEDETALKSIDDARNQLINLLTEMVTVSSQATSESISQLDRKGLDMEFHEQMQFIDYTVASATFSLPRAFGDNTLVVHDSKYGDKIFDLPRCIVCGLDVDVLRPERAEKALKDLASFRDQLNIWLVDGTFDPSYTSFRVINTHHK